MTTEPIKKHDNEDDEYNCDLCEDTGMVGDSYYDRDSNNWIPDGEKPCPECNGKSDMDDNSDEE